MSPLKEVGEVIVQTVMPVGERKGFVQNVELVFDPHEPIYMVLRRGEDGVQEEIPVSVIPLGEPFMADPHYMSIVMQSLRGIEPVSFNTE